MPSSSEISSLDYIRRGQKGGADPAVLLTTDAAVRKVNLMGRVCCSGPKRIRSRLSLESWLAAISTDFARRKKAYHWAAALVDIMFWLRL
jgi:hypothetical protein